MNKTNLQENPMNLVCLFICWCSSPISTSENCVKSCVSIDPTQLSHQIDHRRPVVSIDTTQSWQIGGQVAAASDQ